jgi:hypothetical protein
MNRTNPRGPQRRRYPDVRGDAGLAERARLIELREGGPGEREVTLYVKGFLARGEDPDRFEPWLASHRTLEETHGWGAHALGYHWPSGWPGRLPATLGLVKGAYDVARIVRGVQRTLPVGRLGWLLGENAVMVVALFVRQYQVAARASGELADELAAHLDRLAGDGLRVRVVAHSLGCRQVIDAAARLPRDRRPHEVHLCAPAVREEDVADRLGGLARGRTCLYFTPKDRILDLGFTPLARGRALGWAGPRSGYEGLEAVDVSERFDFWVHWEYKRRLAGLVPGGRSGPPG